MPPHMVPRAVCCWVSPWSCRRWGASPSGMQAVPKQRHPTNADTLALPSPVLQQPCGTPRAYLDTATQGGTIRPRACPCPFPLGTGVASPWGCAPSPPRVTRRGPQHPLAGATHPPARGSSLAAPPPSAGSSRPQVGGGALQPYSTPQVPGWGLYLRGGSCHQPRASQMLAGKACMGELADL